MENNSNHYKNIKAFFSDFQIENKYDYNTIINYDKHIINFTNTSGEIFNLKFKNEIIKIFAIIDGIIIKIIENEDNFNFFKNNQEIHSSKKFRNFILTCNPYSSLYPLSINSNDQFEILKTSKKFPFLLIKENNIMKLVMILNKKNIELKFFETNIEKMINGNVDPFNLGNEPLNQFSSDFQFYLYNIYSFEQDYNNIKKYKIFQFYSDKYSIYISFMNNENNLFLFKIKFPKNNNDKLNIEKFNYKNILNYQLIDNILNSNYNFLYNFKKNKFENYNKIENYNLIRKYLKNLKVSFKTLIFLDNNNNFNFIESGNIIFKYQFNDLNNLKINNFYIKNNIEFYFIDNNNDNLYQINKNFELNDKLTLQILKYFKNEFGFLIYYNIIKILFNQINLYNSQINHFELLCKILCFLFKDIYNKNNYEYKFYKNDNEKKNLSDKLNNTNKNEFSQDLLNEFLNFKNEKNIIENLLNFCLLFFENIKIHNYYNDSYSIKILINFMLNLLFINNNSYILFLYLQFFSNYYQLTFSKEISINYDNNNSNNLKNIKGIIENIYNNNEKYIFNQIENIRNILIEINKIENNENLNENNNLNNNNNNTNSYKKINNTLEEEFFYNDFKIFSKQNNNDESFLISNENFLTKLAKSNYNLTIIKSLNPEISLLILKEISKIKNNPYPFISNIPNNLKIKVLSLIDRLDLARNILLSKKEYQQKNFENLTSLLYIEENNNSNYDCEYYLSKIKFSEDNRLKEAKRILNPTRILKIDSSQLNNIMDIEQLESEKFFLVFKNIVSQYTSCIGNGALNLNTIKTFPKEILEIKPLNIQCLLTLDESNYKLDINKEQLKDKEFSAWAEFNNGVAQSLKLSTENFNNKSYIRNWILFNKPEISTYEHGGFLLGLGLLKQLDSLYATDVYQYMKTTHDGVTIGILLGRSASKISSMEETLSRTLCLHISFLIPSTLEINIPMNIQCSAVMGIGLIYMKSGNKLMTEMLINQIGKVNNNTDRNIDLKHLDSYNLCLGFATGLINIDLVKNNNSYDMNYVNKLLTLIKGNNNKLVENNDENNKNNLILNSSLTAPAGYACLTISYMQSKNEKIANKLDIPKNLNQIESFKPFHLYLAVLAKNLIIWDNIYPSENWIYSNIPDFIKFLYENPLSKINEDIAYTFKLNLIEFSQITTCYFYSLCAGIMSLAFKYCGSNNNQIANIIIDIIKNKLFKINVVNDIIIKENAKYNDSNKSSINKTTLDECYCICSYALSIIMAGSGDLETFKILRILRKKVENSNDYKNFITGYIMSINHAIGILFLGSGGLTFNDNINSLAFLYISTFPIFNKTLNDNGRYLQALRHLYVLSCENKIFETRDVQTNGIVRTKLFIEYLNGNVNEVNTPINIDKFTYIKKIYMNNEKDYYNLVINRDDIDFKFWDDNSNLMITKIAYIKKKFLFDNELGINIKFIDTNNNNCINVIENIINKLKNFLNENELNNEIKISSNLIINQIEYTIKHLNRNNNFDLIYMKMLLLILNEYVNKDNLISLSITNEFLNKVKIAINEGDCTKFSEFKFFLKNKYLNSDDISFNLCLKEIKQFIKRGLFEKYKNNIILYFNNINQIENFKVDWEFIQFLWLNNLNFNEFILILKFIKENKGNDIIVNLSKNKIVNEILKENNFNFICSLNNLINN